MATQRADLIVAGVLVLGVAITYFSWSALLNFVQQPGQMLYDPLKDAGYVDAGKHKQECMREGRETPGGVGNDLYYFFPVESLNITAKQLGQVGGRTSSDWIRVTKQFELTESASDAACLAKCELVSDPQARLLINYFRNTGDIHRLTLDWPRAQPCPLEFRQILEMVCKDNGGEVDRVFSCLREAETHPGGSRLNFGNLQIVCNPYNDRDLLAIERDSFRDRGKR